MNDVQNLFVIYLRILLAIGSLYQGVFIFFSHFRGYRRLRRSQAFGSAQHSANFHHTWFTRTGYLNFRLQRFCIKMKEIRDNLCSFHTPPHRLLFFRDFLSHPKSHLHQHQGELSQKARKEERTGAALLVLMGQLVLCRSPVVGVD